MEEEDGKEDGKMMMVMRLGKRKSYILQWHLLGPNFFQVPVF